MDGFRCLRDGAFYLFFDYQTKDLNMLGLSREEIEILQGFADTPRHCGQITPFEREVFDKAKWCKLARFDHDIYAIALTERGRLAIEGYPYPAFQPLSKLTHTQSDVLRIATQSILIESLYKPTSTYGKAIQKLFDMGWLEFNCKPGGMEYVLTYEARGTLGLIVPEPDAFWDTTASSCIDTSEIAW
jgi:hypothetical protein